MISVDRLMAVRKIVTHNNCPDGLASALILHDALPNAEVVFLDHGSKAHRELPVEEGVLFCDFTPHLESTTPEGGMWHEAGVIVLDHHVTQKDVVEALGGIYAEDRSGALLAYEEVWAPIEARRFGPTWWASGSRAESIAYFARRADVRDRWLTKDKMWSAACEQAAALMFWGWGEAQNQEWSGPEFLDVGRRDLKRRDAECREAIKNGYREMLMGRDSTETPRILIFEGKHLTSDAAEILGDEVDIVVGFGFVVEDNVPKIVFSTRSHTGFDCAALAKHYGGGGHKAAAGFKWHVEDPYAGFAKALRGFLER